MFGAHDFKSMRRTFRKPNILRKRPKLSVLKRNAIVANESPAAESPAAKSPAVKSPVAKSPAAKSPAAKSPAAKSPAAKSPAAKSPAAKSPLVTQSVIRNNCISNQDLVPNNESLHLLQTTKEEQNVIVKEVKEERCMQDTYPKNNSIKELDNSDEYEMTFAQNKDSKSSVPLLVVSSIQAPNTSHSVNGSVPTYIMSIDPLIKSNQLKCNEPNCSKGFWTQEMLNKHEKSHKKPIRNRTSSQVINKCPVKKITADGVEENCGKTFNTRKEITDHLNNDHTLDDAAYRCDACGRRFFWAMGLRTHAGAQCGRVLLPCPWPGCDRTFRQPCRLREHARAHTGDRPYACRFPSCNWAFRSASKLVRHARQHTGDRRYSCGACGRAFLRKEHLRDHVMRRHDPNDRIPGQMQVCPSEGCERSFSNKSSFYTHMKRTHKEDYKNKTAAVEVKLITSDNTTGSILVKSDETNSEEKTTCSLMTIKCEEGRQCARTHCPWPLNAAPVFEQALSNVQLLHEEPQIEQSESTENNVYTVRSDLFLHSNVSINEDNEDYAIGEYATGNGGGEGTGEAAAGLIDAHPTIDLMQEELMYGDTADENSFRVFFLNGEELA